MNLNDANKGQEYIIKDILVEDEETAKAFESDLSTGL